MPIRRIAIGIALSLASAGISHAQRAAPTLGSIGLPATNTNIPNAIVYWAYWGLMAYDCKQDPTAMTCTVSVGNGAEVPHTLCLSAAALRLKGATDSTGLLMAPKGVRMDNRTCVTVPAHGQREVAVKSGNAISGEPGAISISLTEPVNTGKTGSTHTARARVPVLANKP